MQTTDSLLFVDTVGVGWGSKHLQWQPRISTARERERETREIREREREIDRERERERRERERERERLVVAVIIQVGYLPSYPIGGLSIVVGYPSIPVYLKD